MRKELKHILLLSAVVCSAAFLRCANQLTPQGGPKDSLPPVVRLATPGFETRHFSARRIFVEFDEYVQLKEQSKEFFTSPMMKTKPTLAIRGRGVRIDIKDTLLENQTYALNFGSSVRDNNEGNIMHGLRYVFSTGGAIDSMLVTGYTADAMRGDSVSKAFIFFFDAAAFDSIPIPGTVPVLDTLAPEMVSDSLFSEGLPPDTLAVDSLVGDSLAAGTPGPVPAPRYYTTADYDSLLFLGKPSAVGRAEGNGIFIAQNLRDIRYRMYALQDNNGNMTYDPGVDKVGFLDSVHNPADMEAISIWLDEYRRYPTADPQVYFRMFAETPQKRQNLTSSERPGRHQAVLRFNTAFPQIDTLTFEGIPPERVIREYQTAGRDTISLWFDMPAEALSDTIKGRLSYLRTDSLGNLSPESVQLKLAWRYVETREQERAREREERERRRAEEDGEEYTPPEKPNPFRFKVDAGAEVNPEKSIPIQFELPLARIDSTLISLEMVPDLGDPSPVPFRLVRDTMNIRLWTITADWDERSAYRLTVPQGAFTDIAGERNDSLAANFKIQQRSKFGIVTVNVTGKSPEAKYIVQIVGEGGTTIKELKDVVTGRYTFNYLPEGGVRIRITEDVNGNGKWDTGSLVERRQPERVEFYVNPAGDRTVELTAGWGVDADLDMRTIFGPISITKIRADLQKAEDIRVAKWLEDKVKRDAERRKQESQEAGGGGLGIGGALGGAKQQMQSTLNQTGSY